MPVRTISIERLNPQTLKGVSEGFVFRKGADCAELEVSREVKFHQVKEKLEKELAVLVFDEEAEGVIIISADDFILKKISPVEE